MHYALGLVEALDKLVPASFPKNLKMIVQQAENVLQAHQMHEQAMALRISRAYISLQTGEERESIEISEETIFSSVNLSPYSWAKLIYIMALAYSRMGELDYAHKMVDEYGIPAAKEVQKKHPWLPTQMVWLKAEILWKTYLYQNHPDLWCGPPVAISAKDSSNLTSNAEEIFDYIERAKTHAGTGGPWPFNDILSLTLQGMRMGESPTPDKTMLLEDLAQRYLPANPAVSGWALLGAAIIHFKRGNNASALANVMQTHRIAQEYDLGILLRITLVYEIHLKELQSDFSGALYAQKNLNILHHRSIYSAPPAPERKFSEFAKSKKTAAPAHLQKAIAYINGNLHKKLNVLLVAEHCQISRRTLELQFKKHRKTTAAEYIKEKRMQAAADFLLKGEMPMYKVAESLGYSSQSVFSREFSRHYGLPPRSWLKNHQKI